jgi:hypothetical protein
LLWWTGRLTEAEAEWPAPHFLAHPLRESSFAVGELKDSLTQ